MMPALRSLAEAAPFIAELAAGCARERGVFDLALSGGRTPRGVYAGLCEPALRGTVPWEKVRVFWGDERFVPADHPESNFRLAREALLDRVPIPAERVFPIPTGAPTAAAAAAAYERTLQEAFGVAPFPCFDLMLLGIGADGHTASLFPGGPECEERERWVVASRAPAGNLVRERVTLTLPVLNAARVVVFLATGREKRAILEQVLAEAAVAAAGRGGPTGSARPERRLLPAERVRPASGRLLWFVDP